MRILLSLLFILGHFALTLPASAGSLVVLGDSLSSAHNMKPEQGWVHLLEQRIQREGYALDVINASVSGDTTQNGIARLKLLLQKIDADIVIIELGGNDGLRGTPPFAIRNNLLRLIDMVEDAEADVVLLGIQLPANYGAAYTEAFREIYPDIADETDAVFVPFFMEQVALVPERMQADGIHPNAKGQPYLLETVWPHLEALLENID
ncbi:arylesterase [Neptuniibacter sp. 2_MG-2023]|uniref:arylesterase n=1 Tax=Neptuniibacter sp. 2_MG-2023 TaxID=3062671 RepID=UPI0026E43FB9|nr:arylesterase [Neptuniibacter sp. 2_MG-2023]MDO6514892.1 arylesterase [Neptuniibacter sp. 2_MG-2023]